jgi:lysophospholipase L1-like esterase
VKIVFTGSSSVEYWSTTGKEIWDAKYAPLGAVNYGIGGDRTEHNLWRIIDGEFDGLNPEMVVVYCGTNNVPVYPSNDEVVRGMVELMDEIARRLPNTKILYVNLNPRGDQSPIGDYWNRLKYINNQTTLQHDGKKRFVFDMFDDLIVSWGQIKTELFQGDKLHLNADGYAQWDRSWNETFFRVLNA